MYESLFGSPQERELKLKKNGFLKKKNHETHYLTLNTNNKHNKELLNFPGSQVVKTSCFQGRVCGFDIWSGN